MHSSWKCNSNNIRILNNQNGIIKRISNKLLTFCARIIVLVFFGKFKKSKGIVKIF